ncbi:MAG: undecaprenyl-diphosphate phosphatase, partial [Peptococcaceae bacterium]|nr:undecaprenyl-diphosphate phosphatase [Peptococcaceae bacterium]
RFSFLLSTPVILGATLLSLTELNPGEINLPFICGIIVSCLVGMLSISVLLKIVKRYSLNVFVGYRILLGAVIIFLYLL